MNADVVASRMHGKANAQYLRALDRVSPIALRKSSPCAFPQQPGFIGEAGHGLAEHCIDFVEATTFPQSDGRDPIASRIGRKTRPQLFRAPHRLITIALPKSSPCAFRQRPSFVREADRGLPEHCIDLLEAFTFAESDGRDPIAGRIGRKPCPQSFRAPHRLITIALPKSSPCAFLRRPSLVRGTD